MNIDNKKQSTEHHKPKEENLVQDLKNSLEDTVAETKHILDDLEEKVETTINDQSISDATKKIVGSVKRNMNNSTAGKTGEIINTIETQQAINISEEE